VIEDKLWRDNRGIKIREIIQGGIIEEGKNRGSDNVYIYRKREIIEARDNKG
jgi:hypothetical protein